MPEIVPFRGLRFDAERVPPGAEICPPYDVIDADQHLKLLQHHDLNAVRLVLGDQPESPKGTESEYRARGDLVRQWVDEGILRHDSAPSYYLYEYEFTNMHGVRSAYRGVLGAARAKEWGEGVLRHEEIRPKVVDDRLSLLRASGVDTGVVQLCDQGLAAQLAPFFSTGRAPTVDATDFLGDRHRLWVVDEPTAVTAIRELLEPRQAIVADGHHRYTTALRLGGEDPRPGAGHVLTMLGDIDQEGLRIEPTHRILRFNDSAAPAQVASAISQSLDQGSGEPWILERHDGTSIEGQTPMELSEPTFARRISSIWESAATGEFEIENWHDVAAARKRLQELGDQALLCVLPAVSNDEFWKRCSGGEVFPPKTTYFEPKISTGMVIRLIEEEL